MMLSPSSFSHLLLLVLLRDFLSYCFVWPCLPPFSLIVFGCPSFETPLFSTRGKTSGCPPREFFNVSWPDNHMFAELCFFPPSTNQWPSFFVILFPTGCCPRPCCRHTPLSCFGLCCPRPRCCHTPLSCCRSRLGCDLTSDVHVRSFRLRHSVVVGLV